MSETATNWQTLFGAGKLDEALLSYRLQAEEIDKNTLEQLEALSSMRDALRAKSWNKAIRIIKNHDEPMSLVDSEVLLGELERLKTAAETLDKRQPEAALKELEAIQLPVLESEKDALLGTAYIYTNDLDAAQAAFNKTLELDPKHYRVITNLGNLALEKGNLDEAIQAYEQALKIDEGFSNALHNLGVAYRKKGQVNKSVQMLRKAQSSSQRQLREEAREGFRGGNNPQTLKLLRWFIYGVIAVIVFFFLKARGVFF